ncbi:MAG TPA: hypothetical protein VGB17_18815 [Pyrinomonadaceae bacterium]
MANGFENVRPGEIISSDLINRLLEAVSDIQGKLVGIDSLLAGPGKVAVPNLFGFSLGIAKAELMKPKYGLLPGDIFNTGGQRIYPENTAALELAVLNQVPEPGRVVPVGSRVGLVIAQLATATGGTGTGGTTQPPNHIVTGMNPAMPTGARLNQEIHVIGQNFVTPFNRNHVIFDGVHIAIPKEGSSVTDLLIDVPTTIPDVPRSVQVAVEVDGLTRLLPFNYLIKPLSDTPELKITSTSAAGVFVRQGSNLLINGTGFSATAAQNKVTFILKTNTSLFQVVSATNVEDFGQERRLTVPVPNPFTNPAMQPNATGVQYTVKVHIGTNEAVFATTEVQIRTPLA